MKVTYKEISFINFAQFWLQLDNSKPNQTDNCCQRPTVSLWFYLVWIHLFIEMLFLCCLVFGDEEDPTVVRWKIARCYDKCETVDWTVGEQDDINTYVKRWHKYRYMIYCHHTLLCPKNHTKEESIYQLATVSKKGVLWLINVNQIKRL